MKKLLFVVLVMIQQAQAIIVNYTCLTSPDGKQKIHLFADVHDCYDNELDKQQQRILETFLLKHKRAILYIDSYVKADPERRRKTEPSFDEFCEIIKFCYKRKELKTAGSIMLTGFRSVLSELSDFAEDNNIEIKNDPRLVSDIDLEKLIADTDNLELKNADNLKLENAIVFDAQNDTRDIIVFAGVLHILPLEIFFSRTMNYALRSIRDSSQIDQDFKDAISQDQSIQHKFYEAIQRIVDTQSHALIVEGIKSARAAAYAMYFKTFKPLTARELNQALLDIEDPQKESWTDAWIACNIL